MMRLDAETLLTSVSVLTFSLILAGGVWLLAGWYIRDLWPPATRYSLGAVMTLYAVYRIATSRGRYRSKVDGDESDGPSADDESAE